MRKIALVLATAAVAALGTAGPAFAGGGNNGTVSAVTRSSDHPDTTTVANSCAPVSDNGPVWAYDNLSLKLDATPTGAPNTYDVVITALGSFAQVADPNTGACTTGHGSVDGYLHYVVTSPNTPSGKNVPAQSPGDQSQGSILAEFFGGTDTQVGGGDYSYTYNRVDGGRYTQAG
jgi:hypothetical protein